MEKLRQRREELYPKQLHVSGVLAVSLAEQFDDLPIAAVVYTDIAKDGMLGGPNLAATEALALCVSQSTGTVSIFRRGRLLTDIQKPRGRHGDGL